jgi:hypothetical protein
LPEEGVGRDVMDHEEIRLSLAAYLDNAVSGEEKEEIKRHLGMCGGCRGKIADLELTVRYLKSVPEAEPPSWMTEKIMAVVRNEATQKNSLWRSFIFPLHVKLPIEAFAVIFLCITGYYLTRMVSMEIPPIAKPSTVARQKQVNTPPNDEHEAREAPVLARPRNATPPRKMDFPPPVAPQNQVSLPPSPPNQGVTAPSPTNSPPARNMVEPELQPTDDGFMSDRETTFQVREEKVSGGLKGEKKAISGASMPAAGGFVTPATRREEISLAVKDPAAATGAIEEAVTRFGGRIKGHSYSGDIHMLFIRIGADKVTRLLDRLGRIGTLKERPHPAPENGAMIEMIINW